VSERRASPCDRRMTGLTCGWECRGNVIRIRDPRVVGLVARIAICRRTGVFASDVTTSARDGGVRSGKREGRVGMIERRWFPNRGAVTDRAIEWECRSLVVRSDDVVVVVQVTRGTGGAESGVDAAGVAVLAGESNVRASQRELGSVVVELGARPLDCGVADRTVGRESGGNVIRIRRCLVLRQVTTRARGRSACILSAYVTRCARRADVRSSQRELRIGVVIELRASPLHSRVTGLTSRRECRRYVIRVRCLLVVRQVTRDAIGRCASKLAVHVTLRTLHIDVCPRKSEARGRVIEFGTGPLHGRVARLASGREAGRNVIGIRGLLEVRQMA
jgi:hypothetical protein